MTDRDFQTAPMTVATATVAARLHADAGFSPSWRAQDFATLLATPGVAGALALSDDGDPVGLVLWRVAADEGEILTFCVAPAHRRRGVGYSLLQAAAAALRDCAAARMFLEVAVDNAPAVALYRRFGLSEAGRRPGYYLTPAGPVDAIILMKALDMSEPR
jgi:ribosomal-protein-alanine N-acetyltransferase